MHFVVDSVAEDNKDDTTTKTSDVSSSTKPSRTLPTVPSIRTLQDDSTAKLPTAETGAVPKRGKKTVVLNENAKMDKEFSKPQSSNSDTSSGKWFVITHTPLELLVYIYVLKL